jgi:hypothetical protein
MRRIKKNFDELNIKYNGNFSKLAHETRKIFIGMKNDPYISKLKEDVSKLIRELFTDKKGKPTITATVESLSKLRAIFFPMIKDKLISLPLPIIEVDSDKFHFKMQEAKLKLDNFLPDNLHISLNSELHLDFGNRKRNGVVNLHLRMEPISAYVEHIRFEFSKKVGLKYSDYGLLDVHLNDSSIEFYFILEMEKDNVAQMSLDSVNSNLKGLKVKVRDTKHQFLDQIATKLFLPIIQKKVRKALNTKLLELINKELCGRVNKALEHLEHRNGSNEEEVDETN